MKNRIRELRQKHRITQAELSKALGVAQNTLSYWEQGKYDPDNVSLQNIADYFGCSVDYLLCRNDTSSSSSPSEDDIKVALFGGDKEVTDEMWQDVLRFVDFVKSTHRSEDEKK